MTTDINTWPEYCLSVRQPWATSILNGKPVENRSWPTKFRGRVCLHASKGMTVEECADWRDFVNARIPVIELRWAREMTFRDLPRGGIVGEAEIYDCVEACSSPWFIGPYGFMLRNVKPLPFTPCRGALGFFRRPRDLEIASE